VSSRKDRKEALRREREERERAAREAARRKRLVGYGVAGGLVAAVVVVVAVLLLAGGGDSGEASEDLLPSGGEVPRQRVKNLEEAARAGGCKLETQRANSREHTTDPAEQVRYRTNPPTSGKHYVEPAQEGAYSEAPPDTAVVHAEEHGRVIVWFKPGLPEETRANLRALFDRDEGFQMLLVPRANMPYEVAATGWTRDPQPNGTGHLLGCPNASRSFDALQSFIDDYRGNGPEPVP